MELDNKVSNSNANSTQVLVDDPPSYNHVVNDASNQKSNLSTTEKIVTTLIMMYTQFAYVRMKIFRFKIFLLYLY